MAQAVGFLPYYDKNERNAKIRGIDISKWQYTAAGANPPNFFDFAKAFAGGMRFVIMKASGGSTGLAVDPQFTAAHVAAARAAGLLVGAYHYTKPSLTGFNSAGATAEADFFVTTCQAIFGGGMGDIMPFIDFEDPSLTVTNLNDAAFDWLETFRLRVKALTGRACGFYTGYYYIDALTATANAELIHSTKGSLSAVMPLWIAAHARDEYLGVNTTAAPVYPSYNFTKFGGYDKFTLWQFKSDNPDVREGIGLGSATSDLDMDVLEGSLDTIMPPRTVQGISVAAGNGEARITWNRNIDIDLVKYNIYQDDVKVAEVDKADNTVTLPVENYREYIFKVSAVDTFEEGLKSVGIKAFARENDRLGAMAVQIADLSGLNPVFKDARAGGDSFYNPDGNTNLMIKNLGSTSITVTVLSQQKCSFNDYHDIVMTVAAGKTRVIGGLNKERFNNERGVVSVRYSSVTDVKSAAVRFE